MHRKKEFIDIIKQHEGIIYKVSKVYANDKEDQKDLYQEIVYQLWKSVDSFKGKAKISTWIYRIALNTSITFLNQQKRKSRQVAVDFELLDGIDDQDSIMEERIQTLYTHIKGLNIIEKGLILLFLEGKSYDEIALVTGFTNTNVGTRLGRIKQKLKDQIKK